MTEQKQQAARLMAKNPKLTVEQVAKEVGVSRRTLTTWKAEPEFAKLVRTIKNEWRGKARNEEASDPDGRLRYANDRLRRMRAVIDQRSRDPQMIKVPGGPTGLLCVTYKMQSLGEGVSAPIPEYAVDTALLTEMRQHEQHIATLKGEWKMRTVAEDSEKATADLIQRLHRGRERNAKASEPPPA